METLTLNADTTRLLDLVIHSLYTRPEIFLRELVSNASDALDRFRYESFSHGESFEDTAPLGIELEVDRIARTLTVRDHGIGMDRDEIVRHIGTIARSGTQEFRAQLAAHDGGAKALDLIGRFGVGFYSCFMVADSVTLISRKAGQTTGTRWESAGGVEYTLTDAPDAARGTGVTLHLKPVDIEAGIEDYTDRWVLSRIIKRYADFVSYPISYIGSDGDDAPDMASGHQAPASPIVLNSMKPIWTRAPSDVTSEEFGEFYRHISHDWAEPMLRMSFKAEGRWEYQALLFAPSHAPHDLHYHGYAHGLQLYSQRVLIIESCQELLPRYLRFLSGVVDACDLPLNVSRQSLQQTHHLLKIRKWLTKKIIDRFVNLRDTDMPKYQALWREFGRALKEGLSEDADNKDRLATLLLFESSYDDSKLISLSDYVSRMKPEQKEIYYLAGESRALIEHSPQLEECRARGYEVLYFTEPVDELAAQALATFDGRPLRSVAKGQLDLGDDVERDRTEQETKAHAERLGGLLEFMAGHLDAYVRSVRVSKRLTVSPACLTGDALDYSPRIERLLRGPGAHQRRTLELNPNHAVVKAIHDRFLRDSSNPLIASCADLLFAGAVLAEGDELPDPARFTARLTDLLGSALAAPQSAETAPTGTSQN